MPVALLKHTYIETTQQSISFVSPKKTDFQKNIQKDYNSVNKIRFNLYSNHKASNR